MLQLRNRSPLAVAMAVLPDPDGVDTVYATIKATFRFDGRDVKLADEQVPLNRADVFWGEPAVSSIRYASEVHLSKPATDVAVLGHAWAPGGKPVTRTDVRLRVADLDLRIRAIGDREWRPGFLFFPSHMTAPKPFTKMPLTFERAFGGTIKDPKKPEQVQYEPRNPVGRGFAGRAKGRALRGLSLPNLEDPAHLVRHIRHRPAPVCPGHVAPSWEPRRSRAGTYDDAWQKERAPYLPKDFQPAYFNAAHPAMVCKRHLTGGEKVELENVSQRGPVRFSLPSAKVSVSVRLAGVVQQPPAQLESVVIEPDESRLCLVWRAALPCDKQALRVEAVEVQLDGLEKG